MSVCRQTDSRPATRSQIGIFISAAFEFGKLDVIDHTLIVIVLLAIIADDAGGKVAKIRDVYLVHGAYGESPLDTG